MLARVSAGSSEPPASAQQSAYPSPAAGLQHVAAFSAVLSCFQFACGLFNFLVSVVMTNVSRAVGAKAWHQVGPRVWLAIVTAVLCGVLVSGAMIAARRTIFDLLALSPELLSLASPFFAVYAWSVPGIFLTRVVTGVLGGFNRLTVLCVLNVSGALVEVAGVAFALSLPSQSGQGALQAVGFAIALATSFRALVGICLIPLAAPQEAQGRLNFSLCLAFSRDESGQVRSSTTQVGGSTMREPLLLDGAGKRPASTGASRAQDRDGEAGALDAEGGSDAGGEGGGPQPPSAPPFQPLQFLQDSVNMMVRSLCLQLSLWALCISCSRLDPSGALLAAHHVSLQIWSPPAAPP